MDVTNISNGNNKYDSFLVDALNLGDSKAKKVDDSKSAKQISETEKTAWRMSVLEDAIDSLENNLQVNDNSALFAEANAPIETYKEALSELKTLVNSDFDKYAKDAQANLTPADVIYLFEDQISITA